MKIKRIIVVIIIAFGWMAQSVSAQFKVGAEAGYLNNHFHVSSATENQQKHSYLAGVIASYTFRDIGWLESGLTVQQKGVGFKPEPTYGSAISAIDNANMKATYLDLPVLIGLKLDLAKDISIIPKMGGFLSYGLIGTARFNGKTEEGEAFSEKYDVFTALNYSGNIEDPRLLRYKYSRLDAGVQLGLDLMWKQYAIRGAYKFGLTDHYFFDSRINSRTFSISIAYYFLNK